MITRRRFPTNTALFLAAVVMAAGGCARSDSPEPDQPGNLTIEEAGFVAKGRLFEIYGSEADPVALEITGEPADLDGRPVWALQLDVEVTLEESRQLVSWEMWIGLGPDGPEVLSAAQSRR